MAYCINGTDSFNLTKPEDKTRFNEILSWENVNNNIDAAKEIFNREKSGEVVSPDTTLFSFDDRVKEEVLEDSIRDEDLDRISKLVENQINSLKKRILDLKSSANRLKGVDKAERLSTIEDLENLVVDLNELEDRQQFVSIVDYANSELTRTLSWLKKGEKGFDASKAIHVETILALNRQLKTYAGLNVPFYATRNSTLRDKITKVNRLQQDVEEEVAEKMKDVIRQLLKESTNPKFSDKKNIEEYLRHSNDIDGLQAMFIDINTSTDTLLGVIGKKFTSSREEVTELVNEFREKAFEQGKKLLDNGVKDYSWMLSKDKDGNNTANIITRLSSDWKDTLADKLSITDSLEVDERGFKKKREYIKKPVEELSDEEKSHNIKLSEDKKQIADFLKAEYWDKTSKQLVDGENKKYTDSFKNKRATNEIFTKEGWVKSPAISQEEYDKYQKRYYTPKKIAYRLARDTEGEYTGAVEEYETRFVKEEYSVVQDKWNSKEYETIQANPILREFYEFYTQTYKELLDKLPADVAKSMDGKILRIRDDYMTRLLSKKTPMIKRILRYLKELILPDVITNGRLLDESNHPVNDVGIFFVGDLRSEKRLLALEKEIEELSSLTDTDSRKKLAALKNSLSIEKAKPTADEINYDLVESLVAGMQMATNYDVMKGVESSFLVAQEYLHNKKFFKGLDKFGEPIKDTQGNIEYKNEASTVEKRLETWMRMVFYNNSQANNTQVAKIAQVGKRITSLTLQGFNVFSALNNVVTAEGNQVIEAFGGRFYKNNNYHKASMMMKDHLTNSKWVAHLFKNPDKYTDEKPYNKLTALVEHFNMLEEHSDRGGIKQKMGVKDYALSFNWMYSLIEGGEYQAQVRSGLAKLDTIMVKDKEGNDISLLDAYTFDEATNQLHLLEGIELGKVARRNISGEIRNMNKFIHGNYSSVDKVAIQEKWYGEMVFQFRKWIPNAVRNRFSNSYYDEASGMEQEGRYLAIKTMLQNMDGIGASFAKEAWSKLSSLEQANMRKNAAELVMFAATLGLYFIFDSLREGTPPDDERLRATFNFLKKQADRSRGEIDFFLNPMQWYSQVKNPVAGLTVVKDVGEFIGALFSVPFYTLTGQTEKLNYDKGTNKGGSKLWKQTRDLIPGYRTMSQWEALDITGRFFI